MVERLLIRGGVLAGPGGATRVDVRCAGPRVTEIATQLASGGTPTLDANGLTLGPGFVDIHVHGGGGHSFFTADPARIAAYAAWAPRNGVTSFLISTVGDDDAGTEAILRGLAPAVGSVGGAEPLGFHLEGPFINPERKGAFPRGTLRQPSVAEFERYQRAAGGNIRQVTLAPELPGGLDLVRAVTASGAEAAMGHTDATAEEARAGFTAGVRHVTHLFNAMRPIHQREAGPTVAALLDTSVTCELICDGAHVGPDTLRLAYRMLGPERTVIVTDNLSLAGADRDEGRFGADPVTVSGNTAVRADGTIVGSVATMDQHFRNAIAFLGVDLATAFRLCSSNPARVVGAADRKGAIAAGLDADIVLLDAENRVAATVCRGEVAYLREPARLRS
jgi:N-acetylglucosamine-6-phosphate deacetylase